MRGDAVLAQATFILIGSIYGLFLYNRNRKRFYLLASIFGMVGGIVLFVLWAKNL